MFLAVGSKNVCAAFLACVAANGADPAFVHRLAIENSPPAIQVIYDGQLNDEVIRTFEYCGAVAQTDFVCQYHPDDEAP